MQKKLSKQNNSGFTLSEVLIAVAILIVLMGLAMIPITRHQRDLRQTELDAKAEIVYHAAQNKLSELLANGRISDCYAEDLQPLNNTPLDAAERKTSLYYVTSAAKTGEGSAATAILPKDQVDRQLWDNHWVIELDPASGSVYAVFYSEKPLTYDFDSFNPLRFRDGRLSAGATVGYYGGDSVQSEITGKLTPHMEIINKEQLLLRVTCDTPMEPLHFYVTVSDGVHSTSRIELTGSEVKTDYLTYTATMVLDSLTDGMRFGQQARFKNKNLTPGADLTITVEVTCENRLVDSASGTLTANSLFAEVRGGDTAVVTYARHLQNLDTASRLPDSITRAVQEQDIQFVNENADDGWDRLYGSRTFTPITNSRLTYCESKVTVNGQVYHPVIYGLTVNTTGDGGLFAAFSGTLKNLRLCGADITASGNAGGLAGRLSGKTEILDCQVYLSPTRDKLSTKTEQDIWLRGSTAGGLAGRCDGTLTIRRSFAATVIQGVRYAGGLVGNTDSAALTVDHSYADCYLYAAANNGIAGGLIGACNGTANIALSNCYAAGFQSAGTTAGLSGGELSGGDSLKACYSACVRLGTDMKLTYSTVKSPAAGTAPADIDAVYYLFPSRNDLSGTSFVNYAKWSGQNRAEGVKVLGTAFTAETSDTVAYNLMDNMGLSTYSYPRLTGLSHYGDWQADFESGALAYYEKYSDGTYGFLGANRSTLRSGGTVVDDGYGMVYRAQPTDAITVAYTLGGIENTDTLWPAEDIGGGYWLVRLPDALVYTREVSPAFYRQVTVDDISYFFNPHFACRVIQSAALPSAPAEVGIRTARHLHDLSLYYDTYRTLLDKTAVFRQERPIDYNSYARLTVHTQPPIGAADGKPFIHTYDGGGYTIAAPSFTGTVNTDGTSYAGMFGLNRGTLRNIILLTANKDRTVSLEGQLSLQTACIGALTGCNEGTVYNCAAAGFSVNGDARHGSILYLGGLVGGVRYDVSDCYTGGSITVANDLLNERILTGDSTNTVFVNRYESTPKSVKMTQGGAEAGPDTYVYIGGIGGSGFSATFSNFSGSKDGQPTYNNCYTYMTFPAMEGTITGISLIGSIADRAGVSGGTARLTINNCYYLDSSAAIYFGSLPTFYGKSTQSNGQYTYYSLSTLLSTDAARMYMLRGDLSYLSKYTWNTGSSPYNINGLRALSYEQMSGRADIDGKRFTALLNGGSDDGSFHWVTTEENGQSAHGKYSFPGSAAALRGQDYPFPTVLTQGTACLHYGEWPSRGLYWSSGVLSLDRITTPSVTLSLHFTQDTDADAVPVITCSREGIVDVSVPQAQTPPADVRHSYTVTLTGLSVGSTEVFATLGDYTARLLVSVTSTLDISVDGLPGDDFFVGDPCNLTLTARDSRGSALDVEWTVTPQHGNSVLTASAPAVDAGGTASVTLTAAGEGEDRTLITAAYTAPGGETFTSQLPLIIPVRMQGVLGIANTSGEPSVYWQGVMDRDGTAFTDDVPSGAPYTDRPAYAGAKLYLYSRGSAATFDGLSVSGVTVKGGADATEYVLRPMPVSNDEDTSVLHPDVFRAENDDFRVTVGTPAKDTTSAFTYRPLTVKGRSQGQITLTVTLTDAENHAFTLSIPYTLTEEDTRVTATLRVDEQAFTLSVPYGTAPAAEALSQMLTDNGISPDTIDSWTPDITQPLYADTAFTAVPKTTDSGGAPTVPDADTPASGSKDPEGTPSDDPSAPDSSSSGTDPTPEPSPDTLP